MQNYNHLLFDLDGTLADPSEGITKCIAYALDSFGIEISDLDLLKSWIGPPIKQSLMEIYGFDEEKADLGVAKYRERFSTTGIYENKLYPGIKEMLVQLKNSGSRIYLATSKPTVFAEHILKHFEIDVYFDFVGGSDLDDSRPTKTHVIQHVIDSNKSIDLSKSLMIGDRKYDIIGGQNTRLDTAGVLYGFGAVEELKHAGASYILQDVQELTDFLLCKN